MTPMERIEGELSDAQKRIAELERCNVGLVKECQAQQEQITELKNALTRQAKAAQQGMDAAKSVASSELEQAKRLHAECNPDALEGEREANAKLAELVAELERERDAYRAAEEMQVALRQKAEEREAALARDASYHHQEIDSLLGRLRKTQAERDAHLAHSARVNDILFKAFSAIEDGNESALPYDEYRDAFNDAPTTSLTRRDLIKQAEALELVNCQSGPQEDTPQEDAFDAGWDAAFELIRQFASELRQRAEALNESPA